MYRKYLFHLEQPFENKRPCHSKHMEMEFISEEEYWRIKILLHDTEGRGCTQDASKSANDAELEIQTKSKALQTQTYGP